MKNKIINNKDYGYSFDDEERWVDGIKFVLDL